MSVFYWTIAGYIIVGVFLWGKEHGNSIFDRLYRIFCMHVPRLLKKALEKCFGKRAPACLDAAWVYVCYTSNPLVQLFYLLVVVGSYATFVAYSHPHLPNRFISSIHKYIGFGIFSLCLAVWWRACTTDPGTVTAENVDLVCDVWKWDELIFHMSKCRSCDLVKPARSKHCSLCQRCVARFDHHCIWINNCVGVGNHRYFLGFLGIHLVICFYGFGLTATILYEIVVSKELFSAVFVRPDTQERFTATKLMVGQYLLATEGMVVFICVLCCIMGIVLFGFFGWHLYLVRSGTTTNEMSKWSYLKMCLKHEGPEGKDKIRLLNNEYNQVEVDHWWGEKTHAFLRTASRFPGKALFQSARHPLGTLTLRPNMEATVALPADLRQTGRLQGQAGNVDSGAKPKGTTLAEAMNKALMDKRDRGSFLGQACRRHQAGSGYGMYRGPCHPASWSPHETALVQGLKGWQVTESDQVTHAEALLHTDKLEMGKKYQCQLSSRLQRVAPDNSDYYFKPPNCEQNRKYSNLQENPESPRSRRARQMAAAAQQATLQKKPLLAQIRQPVAALERPRAGVAYNIRRLEEWFRLMDTNNSGEITVRKLIIGMMRYQDIMDLIYLLKEKSSGIWQLKPSERPTAGKLSRDDMQWVRGVLSELGQDGHSTMTWPEFVEFFRQSGLLLEYETRDELNSSSLGETSIAAHLKKQEDEEQRFQALFFSRERRGALAPRSSRRQSAPENCALAQTT
ncbi:Probable protein S-acyltransferase 17 (Probable palmitoyltransferase At3g04970) (Zinc finger DHHC domain-containing protein At3g04970) [Durusdinium trenchii]|uniref:Palmitoyltransferase n=1 Tax=Durusdinium trenchii TaxID=1381693 RepID=A0ABP0M004_9DINO